MFVVVVVFFFFSGGVYDQTRIYYSQEPPKLYRQLFRPLKLSFEDSRFGIAILGCGLLVPGQVDLHLRFWSSTRFNRKICFCSTAPGPLQSEIRDGSEARWQKSPPPQCRGINNWNRVLGYIML